MRGSRGQTGKERRLKGPEERHKGDVKGVCVCNVEKLGFSTREKGTMTYRST